VTVQPAHAFGFVAPLRRQVEHGVGAHHHFDAPAEGRIGAIHRSRFVFDEGADARPFLAGLVPFAEIVVDMSAGHLLGGKADAEIVVEAVAVGGHPAELPPHALAVALQIGQRCAGYRDESHVVVGEVQVHAVGVVGHE
jgi:hypothetical protein